MASEPGKRRNRTSGLTSPGYATNQDLGLFRWKTGPSNSKISAWNPRPPASHNHLAETFKVPIIFAPIYVPLLFLAGAVSIPWTYLQKLEQRRQERRFAEQMKKAGRLMQWQEFKQVEANGTGTAIGEYLSMKGPFRLWWTPDDIPATSPHKWKRERHVTKLGACRNHVSNGQLLLRLFDFRACLLNTAFDELGLHFGFLSG
jgi:hypothetical protein